MPAKNDFVYIVSSTYDAQYEEISLDISASDDDIVLKFSRATREVLMTTDEARKHALQMIECADEIDKRKATESGIDTGNILPSR